MPKGARKGQQITWGWGYGVCELPDVSAGNQTLVLCQSSKGLQLLGPRKLSQREPGARVGGAIFCHCFIGRATTVGGPYFDILLGKQGRARPMMLKSLSGLTLHKHRQD